MTNPTDCRRPVAHPETAYDSLSSSLSLEAEKTRKAGLSLLRDLKLREQMAREEGWEELEPLVAFWEHQTDTLNAQELSGKELETTRLESACEWFSQHPDDACYPATERFREPRLSYTLLAADPATERPSAVILQTHAHDTATGEDVCIDRIELPVTQHNFATTIALVASMPAQHNPHPDTAPANPDTTLAYYLQLMGLTEDNAEKLRASGIDFTELGQYRDFMLNRAKVYAPETTPRFIGADDMVLLDLAAGEVLIDPLPTPMKEARRSDPANPPANPPASQEDAVVELLIHRHKTAIARQQDAASPAPCPPPQTPTR